MFDTPTDSHLSIVVALQAAGHARVWRHEQEHAGKSAHGHNSLILIEALHQGLHLYIIVVMHHMYC